MKAKDTRLQNQVKQIKKVSRLCFVSKPTKVKPSGKLYSRKKGKDLSGIILFFLNF
ncbi:hypothetical protein [Leptospira idonii]|uniref:hypothetical protein n=1 Tax=Leptospira idonii TaxID=1193500 RepID=UPI0014386B14|nr:hypothetical protein [Leptospira idonii]